MEFLKYYREEGEKKYKCIIKGSDDKGERECGEVIATSKDSLWNLKRHVSRKHDKVFRSHVEKKNLKVGIIQLEQPKPPMQN